MALGCITPEALNDTVVSASLSPQGDLGEVRGVAAKAQALAPLLQALKGGHGQARLTLHLWEHQEIDADYAVALPTQRRWTTLADLVAHVAARCEPDLSGHDHTLHAALLGDEPRPTVDRAVLTAIRKALPATPPTIRQYALRSWAEWEGRFQGTAVTELFVPLEVQPDARGPRRWQIDRTPQARLNELLLAHDGLGHQAYFLRGAPAGKARCCATTCRTAAVPH